MSEYKGWVALEDQALADFYNKKIDAAAFYENEYIFCGDEVYKYQNGFFNRCEYPTINSEWGGTIKPRNIEQYAAMDMINDDTTAIKLITGPWGSGKSQPIDTIIPTPSGFHKLGEIKVGDYVYDRKGNPTKVLGVFPQGIIDCYKITFNDGRSTYCGGEHIWTTLSHKGSIRNTFKDRTTLEMYSEGVKNASGNYKYRIPLNECIKETTKEFEIDPYVMGCFLGDGNCKSEIPLTLTSADEELIAEVAQLIGAKNYCKYANEYNWHFTFYEEDKKTYNLRSNGHNITTKAFFKNYPQLIDYAYNKSIPEEYFFGSRQQRIDLLQGLLDTDGTIDKDKGRIRFTTTSKQLKDDVKRLIYSLGWMCSESKADIRDKYTLGICYNLSISIPNYDKPLVFRLNRKKQIAIDNVQKRELSQGHSLTIRAIDKMDYQCDMVCIYVDNDEHLYLTNDYIVTHNTMLLAAGAMQSLEKNKFDRIVWVRNNVQVANTDNLGALPGTELDKTLPYVMPLADHCGGVDGIMRLIDTGRLEVIPLGFLRGRSIRNALILCSEAENLTKEHIQLIMGRIDEGSQLWLDADTRQRDRVAFEKSRGVETMIDRLKGEKLFGYVKLEKSERSAAARLADRLND